jgi:hypothetical protein
MVHVVPSQCIVRRCSPPKPEQPDAQELPTAQISLEEKADTPSRTLFTEGTLGLGTILHEVPSQWRVRVCQGPEATSYWPTAQTSLGAIADTEVRWLSNSEALGEVTWVQARPSQWRMRFRWRLPEGQSKPTAQIFVGERAAIS